ncbi:MAG: DUF1194 domain-containing protein [Gammaproteobacteria bacterium]
MSRFIHSHLVRLASVIGLLMMAMQVQAVPVTTELGLAIDRSGSISGSNFILQRDAYANVLNNASVLPQDGSVAIGVWSFGATVIEEFPLTQIDGTSIASLIAAINGMTQVNSGATALGPAIGAATTSLVNYIATGSRQVIDVSTDGFGNTGTDQVTAANAAIAAGIDQVNCLGVGSGANCNFATGTDSFSVQVSSFSDFQVALERKILRETQQIPEPTTLMLMGAAALGLGFSRRRRAA